MLLNLRVEEIYWLVTLYMYKTCNFKSLIYGRFFIMEKKLFILYFSVSNWFRKPQDFCTGVDLFSHNI